LIHPWNRVSEFSRLRASRPLVPSAGALVAACCVAACASGAASTATTATTTAAGQTSSPAAGSADVHGTPGAVLADWLHQIVVGDYKTACADMADTSKKATPGPSAAAACATAKTATATLTALHGNFTADGLKPATPISVTSAQVTGTKATVNGTEVRASGKTLKSLMLAHSTGVTSKSFSISFDLAKIDGGWYVTDLGMNI
jgi:hypothetical protein